ncbi:MAG: xanthine dehydrogenase family protein subunit M [Vicinamibacterales bacterium]
MIPAAFTYERASTLDDAIARLAASGGDAKLLAGGHSLLPLMKLRLAAPAHLIDIGRIPGLSGIRAVDGGIEIGAGTVHHEVATSALVRATCPAVADAAASIGDVQVRHRGTLGGSLAHADPSADYPAALLAAEATVHVQGPRGARTIRSADFHTGLFSVDLSRDEIIVAVRIGAARASAYEKLYQRASHFAIVGVAASLDLSAGHIVRARIGLTGVASCPRRLAGVEASLEGQPATGATFAGATARAADELDDVAGDLHASEAYRRAMVGVFVQRALRAALARAS